MTVINIVYTKNGHLVKNNLGFFYGEKKKKQPTFSELPSNYLFSYFFLSPTSFKNYLKTTLVQFIITKHTLLIIRIHLV